MEEERSPSTNTCWFCPLQNVKRNTELELRQQMQQDELPESTCAPWNVPCIPANVEASSRISQGSFEHQHVRPIPAHRYPLKRRGHVGVHGSRRLSRRHLLGQLVKGVGLGALGASIASTGYLITTGLLKRPLPQGSSASRQLQELNTARVFTNPRDGQQSLLIRLPDGTNVAYERKCTHVGVYVNYNTQTHMLVCPAHGAIFDPARGARVVEGPATRPLPQVPLSQGSDGTILIGEGGAFPPIQ